MGTLALYVNDAGELVKVVSGQEYPCSREYSREVADLILTRQGGTKPGFLHDAKTLMVYAKSFFKDLRRHGFSKQDIMTVSGELLKLVADEIKEERKK